ncbi:alpha/beta fold hydrolase [Oryzobacter sp. R7]|uniref:alpha/beta fold hydrolase n=1 Tax=Oryzobacter faecalis TaxID=3388656 RepID=UPI00398CF289
MSRTPSPGPRRAGPWGARRSTWPSAHGSAEGRRRPGWTTPRGATAPAPCSTSAAVRGAACPRVACRAAPNGGSHPFVEAGYTVCYVSRRRGMPRGHTVEDVADDVSGFVREQLGGRADLVVGVSYGGMVAQLLAARHGRLLGRVALVASAARVNDWGRDVDARLAAAVERGDRSLAGATFGEYVLPAARWRWLRRLAGPLLGRMLMSGRDHPASDVVVEAESEVAFDARPVLPGIRVPVLVLCGDEDQFFAADVVAETVRLVPGARFVGYPGRGHLWVASSRQVPRDILRWLAEQPGPAATEAAEGDLS